jgi:biopolymer transport protein ExbD/biopolymer transport protein TolR
MVTWPITLQGLDVPRPQPSKSPDRVDQSQAIVVQLLGNCDHGVTYKINETALNKREVESKLAEIFATRNDKAMPSTAC